MKDSILIQAITMQITGSVTMHKSFSVLCLLLFTAADCFSGDNDHFLAIRERKNWKSRFIYSHVQSIEKSLDLERQKMPEHKFHSPANQKGSKLFPAFYMKSAFPRSSHNQALNLLASEDPDVEIENLPIPESCVILVMLKMDVNKLNTTLLRKFRQGVAAALGLMPQQVHINRLNGKKNCVELFISPLNKKIGVPDALPSAEVLRSLNLHTLHQRLSHFGITEVSPEKNVLHGQHEADKLWTKEGFYTIVIFLSTFVIIVTCLMQRGSNVSLTLDMSSLGIVEPFTVAPTPREKVTIEYLQTASRVLTRQQLHDVVQSPHLLHTEFMPYVPSRDPISRVCLKPKNLKDALSTYINANFIRGYGGTEKTFIATQGPMINTVNDFWQMVWQEDVPVIVMITKLKEKNEKCVLYWPEKRGIYGNVEVLVNSVNEHEYYTIRILTLKQGSQSRIVKHYWYTSWPDHKTPDSAQPLLQLMLDVEDDRKAFTGRGPVVVHCSAGIGRTGCFISTSIGCCQLKEEGVVDVLSIVCKLRMDRGGMVQTSEQYQFVHHALSLYESRLSAEKVQ
uniref:protein-tyrosine-phosphatase n=1 Tax=Pyxicephalus adspersus TaxID=30357 RepID=A0AAV3AU10_PYXAD|nr:TPA: hypothetical protein GDO54_007029 [Pyxicephalus adspersus]